MTWFAILVAVNLQTAWLSPPVALSAYFLKGSGPRMGFKRYLYGDDAIYGFTSDRININSNISTNSIVATNLLIWQLNILKKSPKTSSDG